MGLMGELQLKETKVKKFPRLSFHDIFVRVHKLTQSNPIYSNWDT